MNFCTKLFICHTKLLLPNNTNFENFSKNHFKIYVAIIYKQEKTQTSLTGHWATSGKPHFGPNLGLLRPN